MWRNVDTPGAKSADVVTSLLRCWLGHLQSERLVSARAVCRRSYDAARAGVGRCLFKIQKKNESGSKDHQILD